MTRLNKMTQLVAVKAWLQHSEAGSRILYHTGDLASQRVLDEELDMIAEMLYRAATIYGSVDLTQKKVSPGIYRYIATRRSNVR